MGLWPTPNTTPSDSRALLPSGLGEVPFPSGSGLMDNPNYARSFSIVLSSRLSKYSAVKNSEVVDFDELGDELYIPTEI